MGHDFWSVDQKTEEESFEKQPPTPPPPPLWSPKPSPTSERKEFRPVKFESPTLPRRYVQINSAPVAPPPWSYTDHHHKQENKFDSPITKPTEKLKKQGAYIETEQNHHLNQDFNSFEPNDFSNSIKNEYMTVIESENDGSQNMAQLNRKKLDGVGPTTKDGIPISLRSEVDQNNQHKWYKTMFNTLHKVHDGDESVIIRYKSPRGRYLYKSKGYMSEPETNDSNYTTMKYTNKLGKRTTSTGGNADDDQIYGTMPNLSKYGSRRHPGKIEDFTPGQSSASEKKRSHQQWEQQKLSPSYTEGNLSRVLKEQGYESESNVIFRKRVECQSNPLSPVEQKQVYLNVQSGGEPPLNGFRKPAPEKPKENDIVPSAPAPPPKGVTFTDNGKNSESYYRYFENIVNKSPIRYECKDIIQDEELAHQQRESLAKIYQKEREKKHIQELKNMNNRRHADNFIPSQKLQIPLNRFDDFNADLPEPKKIPKTLVKALYNFTGESDRELSFKKGDVMYIKRLVDTNWYEGEHNGRVGLLPANYIQIISKNGTQSQQKRVSEGQGRAKYNFQAQSAFELSLNKGELVTLIRQVDENWFEGKIANRKGIFPVSYVEILTDIGAEDLNKPFRSPTVQNYQPSLDILRTNLNHEFNTLTNGHPANEILKETKTQILHVDTDSQPIAFRALYKYRPQNNDELELQESDIIYVLEMCDDGWYVGTSQRTGCFGTFPGNYVERV